MNSLKIYYYKDYVTEEGSIVEIIYNKKTLATFNKELGRIDLSVMNPFVGKVADFFTVDVNNKKMKQKEVLIARLEQHETLGTIMHIEDIEREIK